MRVVYLLLETRLEVKAIAKEIIKIRHVYARFPDGFRASPSTCLLPNRVHDNTMPIGLFFALRLGRLSTTIYIVAPTLKNTCVLLVKYAYLENCNISWPFHIQAGSDNENEGSVGYAILYRV